MNAKLIGSLLVVVMVCGCGKKESQPTESIPVNVFSSRITLECTVKEK